MSRIVLGGTSEGRQGWDWDNWPIDARQMAEGAVGDALMARELLDHFEMDRVDWCHVLWQADRLGRRQDFRRLGGAHRGRARTRRAAVRRRPAGADGTRSGGVGRMTAGLEHKAVEAQTHVANDLGQFSALAATYDVDRVKDRIRFGAFEQTIADWRASGKRVPLHWEHRGEARNVIGSADPARMREVAGLGLYVEGEAGPGRQRGRPRGVALHEGQPRRPLVRYMTVSSQRRGGISDLLELDLYEISITPGPINPRTRILEMKSSERDQADLRRRCDQLALEAALGFEPCLNRPSLSLRPSRSRPTPSCASRPGRSACPSHRRAREPQQGSAPGSIRPATNSSRT